MAIVLLPSAYVVYDGIEGIARSSQVVFLPTVIICFSCTYCYPMSICRIKLPVFEDGAANILEVQHNPSPGPVKSCFDIPCSFNKQINKTAKYSVITIILIGFGGFIGELYTGFYFSGSTSQTCLFLIRYIKPTAFIERYDILFVTINLLGNFVKLSVFLYVFVLCLSQWLGMKATAPWYYRRQWHCFFLPSILSAAPMN